MNQSATQNIQVQRWVAIVSFVLFTIKIIAYYSTYSVAILSDALESIVNIVAACIGLYSLSIAAKPRDHDHPYGHGKVEYVSAAVEGVLIAVAGIIILYKAIHQLIVQPRLQQVDYGILLIASTAVINYILGWATLRIGKRNHSIALTSSGKHLLADTWSTVGIVLALIIVHYTGLIWLDGVVAIIVSLIILVTGIRIITKSIDGIMDKADLALLTKVIATLEQHRTPNWIDLHNLRIVQYGSVLHIDAHLTVPWYITVQAAHDEVDALSNLIKHTYGHSLELFVHTDGCLPTSCGICHKEPCGERVHPFVHRIPWNTSTVLHNQKHGI